MDKKEREQLAFYIRQMNDLSERAGRFMEKAAGCPDKGGPQHQRLMRDHYDSKFRYWEFVLSAWLDFGFQVHEHHERSYEDRIRFELKFYDDCYHNWGGGNHLRTAGL